METTERHAVRKGFKSPMTVASTSGSKERQPSTTASPSFQHCQAKHQLKLKADGPSMQDLKKTVGMLKAQILATDEQIQQLRDDGLDESELDTHIVKLHEYNEIKDTAQMVLGERASLSGMRVKELYEQYDLNLDD